MKTFSRCVVVNNPTTNFFKTISACCVCSKIYCLNIIVEQPNHKNYNNVQAHSQGIEKYV